MLSQVSDTSTDILSTQEFKIISLNKFLVVGFLLKELSLKNEGILCISYNLKF